MPEYSHPMRSGCEPVDIGDAWISCGALKANRSRRCVTLNHTTKPSERTRLSSMSAAGGSKLTCTVGHGLPLGRSSSDRESVATGVLLEVNTCEAVTATVLESVSPAESVAFKDRVSVVLLPARDIDRLVASVLDGVSCVLLVDVSLRESDNVCDMVALAKRVSVRGRVPLDVTVDRNLVREIDSPDDSVGSGAGVRELEHDGVGRELEGDDELDCVTDAIVVDGDNVDRLMRFVLVCDHVPIEREGDRVERDTCFDADSVSD